MTGSGFSTSSNKTIRARRSQWRIATQLLVLLQFTEGGRPGRVEGTRELVVRRTPYIVAYRVEKDCVRILRILHSAQLWPGELTDPL